jgi:pimeloyl-ACP methyl ester carboxylesterase
VLVAGDEDAVAPASVARTISDRMNGAATVRVLSRCGHWQTLERAADCTAILGEALQGRG